MSPLIVSHQINSYNPHIFLICNYYINKNGHLFHVNDSEHVYDVTRKYISEKKKHD